MAFPIKIKFFPQTAQRFEELFQELLHLIRALVAAVHHRTPKPTFQGGEMTIDIAPFISVTLGDKMTFTIPNDTADAPYSITPLTGATDAEGEPVTVTEKLTSSDPTVVKIIPGPDGDIHNGSLSFGKSGACSVDYVASYKVGRNDVVLKQSDATFILTTGNIQPGSVSGGDFSVPSLTPDPEPMA